MSTPATLDFNIYRGDDYVHQLVFTDDATPPVSLNLSAYTFRAEIRDRPENGTVIHGEFDIDTSQAADGIIVLSLLAVATNIPPGFWDLEVNDGSSTQTWFAGAVNMSGDVTQEVVV